MPEPQRRCVYVLRSLSHPDRHYVGLADDMAGRLAYHNSGACPRTITHKPWQLVVLIQFLDGARAVEFEKYLKSSGGRAFTSLHFS